ncbi:MAG TPA: hypothetical protein VMP08_22995 [Anaerolineae bacterium]|nr:hypothetical protein [Anaerolineae bacterium]
MHDHRNTQSAENQSFCETDVSAESPSSSLPGLPLKVPIPPQLEAAVGYRGAAHFFGLYWTPAGDEAMVTDGRTTHDGCWWGYQAFVDHPVVMLALAGHRYDLGSSDSDATHWLVIDRETRTASLAPRAAAEQFLAEQHPALPCIELTPKEWEALVKDVSAQLRRSMEEVDLCDVREQLAAQNTIVGEMTAWLDQYRPANWQIQIRDQLSALGAAE